MDIDEILFEAEEHYEKSLTSLASEFRRIRTGRANAGMLDHIQVEVYGTMVPIKQVAGVTTPEPQQLLIKPYDKGTLHAIERALAAGDLGVSPNNDGTVIRINLPPLSGERRKQLAAQAKEVGERCRVAMRNARRDAIKQIESTGKDEKWSEDAIKKATDDVTELLRSYEAKVDDLLKEKTDDILSM